MKHIPKTCTRDEINVGELVNSLVKPGPKFKLGDKVRWKFGLKNKKYPKTDQTAVVIEELENPVKSDDNDSGSPYFNELLDLVIAIVDEDDGKFMIFHYDKRRFELCD